jgi:hypothetical protein
MKLTHKSLHSYEGHVNEIWNVFSATPFLNQLVLNPPILNLFQNTRPYIDVRTHKIFVKRIRQRDLADHHTVYIVFFS